MNAFHRLDGHSAELHAQIADEMRQYGKANPHVNIDITSHCSKQSQKFKTVIEEIATNQRFACGSKLVSRKEDCATFAEDLQDEWTPFDVHCPGEKITSYSSLLHAIAAKKPECTITEPEPRHLVTIQGWRLALLSRQRLRQWFVQMNTCCAQDMSYCTKCNLANAMHALTVRHGMVRTVY